MDKFIEPGSIESIKELVKNGLGIGVVAQWPIRAELQSGELVTRPLGKIPLGRQWHAVHLRNRPLNETENAFVRFFRLAAERLVNNGAAVVPQRIPAARRESGAVVV